MSWSATAVGKGPAVAKAFAEAIERAHCREPEETIKNLAGGLVATALAAFPPNVAVKVSARGSQNTSEDGKTAANDFSLTIEPIYGFIE